MPLSGMSGRHWVKNKIHEQLKTGKMKKKITLLTLIIAVCGFIAPAQTIQNTTWSVYNASGSFFGYFRFHNDTLSYSDDNTTYTNVSTYQLNGNIFTLVDLPPATCPVYDTGRYTYLIKNDTLRFTLINDPCAVRVAELTTIYCRRFQTGVQNINSIPVTIYPNPAGDELFIKSGNDARGSAYIITDLSGRQLLTGKLTGEITPADIKQLPGGIYFFQLAGERTQQYKFIKR